MDVYIFYIWVQILILLNNGVNNAQQSFELSLINEASEWEKTNGDLPSYDNINSNNYGCTVKHHKFNQRISIPKHIWRNFIANRSWSTLQSLTPKALKETLKFVDEKYKKLQTVDLDLQWTLSVVKKEDVSPTNKLLAKLWGNMFIVLYNLRVITEFFKGSNLKRTELCESLMP